MEFNKRLLPVQVHPDLSTVRLMAGPSKCGLMWDGFIFPTRHVLRPNDNATLAAELFKQAHDIITSPVAGYNDYYLLNETTTTHQDEYFQSPDDKDQQEGSPYEESAGGKRSQHFRTQILGGEAQITSQK